MVLAFIIIITSLLYLFYIVDTLSIPLFLIFLILKLCGVITWSWLMVCLPLIIWASALLITSILTGILSWICVENN